MKIVLFALCLFASATSTLAFGTEGVITSSASTAGMDMTKTNFTEFGFQMSSIDSGTLFADLSFGRNFNEWFTGMVRGFLPMTYSRASQTYGGQLVGRFNLINEINLVYLEATLGEGIFAPQGESTASFETIGANYGYAHRFSGDFTLGVNLGLDYSGKQLSRDHVVGTRTVFSHAAIVGGYFF